MIAIPKALYLRPFLEMRLVAKLQTMPKRVMVYWVCMMFHLFARSIEAHPNRREDCCSQVAASRRCQERQFLERDPELARGEESNTRRGGRRNLTRKLFD